MTDKKSRWSTDEKIRIVLQTLSPQTSMAEVCREHNLVPRTVYGWKEKFLADGHSSLEGPDASKQVQRHKKEITPLKSINGECAVANDALKKSAGGQARMIAAHVAREMVGLNRAPLLCGVSKRVWYYTPPDPETCRRIPRFRR